MMDNPLISVIVPNYNHSNYLRQRFDTILNQTYQYFEVIILDDCSTDISREIIKQYESHSKVSKVCYNNKNSGNAFLQWNKGILLAKGEWIWIAESDDYSDLSFLETMVKAIKEYDSCGFAFAQSRVVNENGELIYEVPNPKQSTEFYNGLEFIKSTLIYDQCIWNVGEVLFKRQYLPSEEKRNLYSTLHLCGDWLFYIMIMEQTDVLKVNKTLNNYRRHPNSISSDNEFIGLGKIETLSVFRYSFPLIPFWSRRKRLVDSIRGFCRSIERYHYPKYIIKEYERELFKLNRLSIIYYFPCRFAYWVKYKTNQ